MISILGPKTDLGHVTLVFQSLIDQHFPCDRTKPSFYGDPQLVWRSGSVNTTTNTQQSIHIQSGSAYSPTRGLTIVYRPANPQINFMTHFNLRHATEAPKSDLRPRPVRLETNLDQFQIRKRSRRPSLSCLQENHCRNEDKEHDVCSC